jgi:phospholipase/carboxylesterase
MRLQTYVIAERGALVPPTRMLVLLHGYDATEHDLTALGPLLDPDVRFLVAGPRGPVAPAEGSGAAWFSYGPLGPDPATFHDSLRRLHDTVDALCAEHLMARDELVIGGFSQGAAMALAFGLGRSERTPPAGVLCLSGYLADVEELDYDWEAGSQVPVLVQHGTRDRTVPVELGRDTAATLAHHGIPVTFQEFDMAHQTTIESLAAAQDWLAAVRDGARPTGGL